FWLPLRLAWGLIRPRRQVLGGYFAGVVESFGAKAEGFEPGDQVFGSSGFRFGAYAQYLCLPASYSIASKPATITFEEAASVPLGGLNALHFMRRSEIKAGEKILINGAGGSIGIFAVQIAKAMGAEVTAVDSAIKKDMLCSIGADHFIDYTQADFTDSGEKYDVVFNMVAGTAYEKCLNVLNPRGRYLIGNPQLSDILRSALTSRFTDKTVTVAFAGERVEELRALGDMIETGQIKPVVDKVYGIREIAQAHFRVETEQRTGAVIIDLKNV
ncbi:MAG: NAD(P)-dependent alcohol dehydrogenase, partial [Pseudomonadales bacterium]|nr:NAD(P)-dependent alcohol dehydrogenase [Pseudomonadales bacterium]